MVVLEARVGGDSIPPAAVAVILAEAAVPAEAGPVVVEHLQVQQEVIGVAAVEGVEIWARVLAAMDMAA